MIFLLVYDFYHAYKVESALPNTYTSMIRLIQNILHFTPLNLYLRTLSGITN